MLIRVIDKRKTEILGNTRNNVIVSLKHQATNNAKKLLLKLNWSQREETRKKFTSEFYKSVELEMILSYN